MVDYTQDPAFVGWLNQQIGRYALEAGTSINVAASFGIKPGNSDVVNDAALAALKATMVASPSTTWYLEFPGGAYTYTNNRWLWGVQKVVIDAYDASFQCTAANLNYGNGIPLFNGDIFGASGDTPAPVTLYTNGYLFNTAASGATSITCTTHADAGNFTPGMRVLLSGYDQQQGGYPPNLRYFDYKVVLTANATTGVITFTDALQNFYDSRWWDTANYAGTGKAYGAPRILSLDRADWKRAQLIWVKGATFLPQPGAPDNTPLQLTADLLIYEDVSARYYTIQQSGVQIMERCNAISVRPGDQSSADKLIDRLIISKGLFDVGNSGSTPSFVNCSGCNSVALLSTKFFGSVKPISPRSLFMSDCDVVPLASDFVGIATASLFPLRAVTLQNNRIYNTGGLSYGFTNTATPGGALTVGTVVGTDIRLSFDATGKTVADSIEYGMTLTCTATGNTGIITAIYYEAGSPGTLRIAGTWSAPSPGNVFNFYDVMQPCDAGGNVIVGAQVPFWRGPPALFYRDSPTFTGTTTVGTLALTGTLQIPEGGVPAIAGFATLVGGTKTVANTLVTNASYALVLTRSTASGALGHLSYTITDFTSFTINSTSGTDTSTIYWIIVRRG